MVYRNVRGLETVLFLGILGAWGASLFQIGIDRSEVYSLGWPYVTAVLSLGAAAFAASTCGSLIRGFFREAANEHRAVRRLGARPPLPEWTELAAPLRNLARHAYMVLTELGRGTPVEGDVAWRVAQFRGHMASLEEPGRHALEQRGIDVPRILARLEEAMFHTRGDPGAEVDRIVTTFLVAAAVDVPSSPYRG